MTNRKQPEVRFKGFTEEWVEHKVRNIGDTTYGGGTPKTFIRDYWKGEIPWIQSSDLSQDQVYNIKTKKYITKTAIKKSAAKLIPANSIAIVTRVGVGKLALVSYEYSTSQDFLSISQLNIDNWFGIYALYKMLQSELQIVQGTSIKGITKDELLNKRIVFPINNKEQQKIGTFFKQLDDKIALQERQIELLKEQKKGFLQKMFPKTGEKTPEVRFAGFTEEWEKRKLGEISDIVGGGTPSTSQQNYWDGEIDWYSPAEIGEHIYMFGSNKKITELGLKKSSAKVHPIGTVLFTSRAGIGKTAILKKEGSTNQGFQSILPKKNILDSYFIFSRTKELKRYGEVTGAGSTFIEVSGKQMEKMVLKIPSYIEQVDLGKFFKKLDDNIALNQKELKILKQIKKGFLKKMFV